MTNYTKGLSLFALLIVGLVIGYLRQDYTDNKTITIEEVVEDAKEEFVDPLDDSKYDDIEEDDSIDDLDDSAAEEDESEEETLEEETDENEEEENEEENEWYSPYEINQWWVVGYDEFPAYDKDFEPTGDKDGSWAPHIVWTNERTTPISERFKITGTSSTDIERIDVIWDGDNIPFTLKKYVPGWSNFEYNVNPEFGNVKEGKNRYLIRGYAKDNIYQNIIELEYNPSPSAADLDESFTN